MVFSVTLNSGKMTKDGLTDPEERWKKISLPRRNEIESVLGPFPFSSIAQLPLDRSTYYACRDADATFRIDHPILDRMQQLEDLDQEYILFSNSPFHSYSLPETSRRGKPDPPSGNPCNLMACLLANLP